MTFWVGQNFPALIICFVLAIESEMKKSFNCEIRFYINSEEVYELEMPRCFSGMVTDHVWVYDLRTHPSIQRHHLDSYLVEGWNQVEISCEKISGASNVTVSLCGVHVCKDEANMKDILFKDPDPDSDLSRDSEEISTDLVTTSEESTKSIEDFQYCKRLDDSCHNNFNNLEVWCETQDSVAEDSIASVVSSVCPGGTDSVKGKHEFYIDMHYFHSPLFMLSSYHICFHSFCWFVDQALFHICKRLTKHAMRNNL